MAEPTVCISLFPCTEYSEREAKGGGVPCSNLAGTQTIKIKVFSCLTCGSASKCWLITLQQATATSCHIILTLLLTVIQSVTSIVYITHIFIKIKYNIIVCKASVMPMVRFHSFRLCCIKLDNGHTSTFCRFITH